MNVRLSAFIPGEQIQCQSPRERNGRKSRYNSFMSENASDPRFACDAMLGGLARWLRAAGYDATWHPGIDDREVVRLAEGQRRLLLSCDTGIFRIRRIRDGDIRGLWIPHGLGTQDQLAFVLRELRLPVREPRCMACGGLLAEVPKRDLHAKVPARSFAWLEQFWRCQDCGRILWRGTHWHRIAARLQRAQSAAATGCAIVDGDVRNQA